MPERRQASHALARGRRATALVVLAVLCAAPGVGAQEPAQVVTTRAGMHPDFDRVVVQLDRPAPVVWARAREGALELRVDAQPRQPEQVFGEGAWRMGVVTLAADGEGLLISNPFPPGPVRVFELQKPPRIVVDFAAGPVEAFDAPADSRPILPEPEPEPLVVEPPAPPIGPEPTEPELVEPELVEPELVELPAPVTEPAPVAEAAPPVPEHAMPTRSAPGGPMRWLPLAAVFVVVILLGTILLLTRRRRRQPAVAGGGDLDALSDPEVITPAEIDAGSDRVEILERRLDDEVRARVQLEDQLASAREEQKVLRDRLRRLGRDRQG